MTRTPGGYDIAMAPAVPWEESARSIGMQGARLFRLLDACDGQVRLIRDVADLDACLAGEALGVVFHFEGAEAIDTDLDALDVWYAAGLRSVGLVWSRPNAFAHGVPFRFPSSPDTGPGLTDAGFALVRRCAELRHRDRPQPPQRGRVLGRRPHARRPADRLALGRARALHLLAQPDRRPARRDQGLERRPRRHQLRRRLAARGRRRRRGHAARRIADHARYVADRIGVDHVALGSDFDGATMPAELPDAGAYPGVLAALEAAGFEGDEVARIASGNWRRVLAAPPGR